MLPDPNMTEIRIGIMGNVDSGKSTLTGVLTKNILDDGRGKARNMVMKHKHELASGRTSCVTHHYTRNPITEKQQVERHITYVDLAGHEKYLRTTVNGIHRCYIDYAIVVIGANMGMESSIFKVSSKNRMNKSKGDIMIRQVNMTEEHLNLCLNLAIPTIIVVTKTDIAPEHILNKTLAQIDEFIKIKTRNSRKTIHINSMDEKDIFLKEYYNAIPTRNMLVGVPVIQVSSVTGVGLDILKSFIENIPQYTDYALEVNNPVHYVIDSTYHIDGIGIVVSGILRSGVIKKGDILQIGPIGRNFYPVIIKSIHNNFREFVEFLQPGHTGCFAIKPVPSCKFEIKRHMLKHGTRLMSNPETYTEFRARIKVLHHPTMIKLNYEPTIHCGPVIQCAKIIEMEKEHMRLGDVAEVKFRFKFRPEFIQPNAKLVFREGMTRGIGKVISVGGNS